MNWQERRAALAALSERDKRILALARAVSNNLGFAAQNTHSERIQEKYERAADQAMMDLENLLLYDTKQSTGDPTPPVSANK